MSPIDDELRAALHGRAKALAPAPDPLAGIEARARRIQRNRVGAAVAGSALAVAATLRRRRPLARRSTPVKKSGDSSTASVREDSAVRSSSSMGLMPVLRSRRSRGGG